MLSDSSDSYICIIAESAKENKTSISAWKESDSEYVQEKEFKIDHLQTLSKVIFLDSCLYALDL